MPGVSSRDAINLAHMGIGRVIGHQPPPTSLVKLASERYLSQDVTGVACLLSDSDIEAGYQAPKQQPDSRYPT